MNIDDGREKIKPKFSPANNSGLQSHAVRRTSSGWVSVTPSEPCRVCASEDWCSRTRDGGVHACRRSSVSAVLGKGSPKPDKGGPKWLFFSRTAHRPVAITSDPAQVIVTPTAYPDITDKAVRFADKANDAKLAELGERIGVPAWAVKDFPLIGWDPEKKTWMFPAVDGAERIVGLARRNIKGGKGFLFGTHAGLFVSPGWKETSGTIFIVEGQSDVMALHAAGLCAIGRSSAFAGADTLAELLRDVDPCRRIVFVGEHDLKGDGTWVGRAAAYNGAAKLAEAIGRPIYWSPRPPNDAKDSREWFSKRAKRRVKQNPDPMTRILIKANDPRIFVVQSRERWARLGQQFAHAVLSMSVSVEPGMSDLPKQRQECRCPTPFFAQFKGKPNTTAAGKRACGDARCFRWNEAACRTWWANRWSAWLWRCMFSYGDPARCPERDETDAFPWPNRPDHEPAGPWGLYAAVVTPSRFKQIRTSLAKYNTTNERNAEYVWIRLDRWAEIGGRAETGAVIEDLKLPCCSITAPVSARTAPRLVTIAIRPGVPLPRGLNPISARDAADLINAALHEIGSANQEEGTRNQPVNASTDWKLPEEAARTGRWTLEARSGIPAKKVHEIHVALAAVSQQTLVAEGIQESTVREDSAVGGELASWFLGQTHTPEHCDKDTGIEDILWRFNHWKKYLRELTDGPSVREYLAAHAGDMPGPDDRKKLLAAVEADKKQQEDEERLEAEYGDAFTGNEWATAPLLRAIEFGRKLIHRIDRAVKHPIGRATLLKKVRTSVFNEIKNRLRGVILEMQLPRAQRYASARLALPRPKRGGTMFTKRQPPSAEIAGLAALAH